MEPNIERECSALGGLFQQIIADMKNGTPLWEDLVAKATKLHTCLRATIQAIAAYLDAFQRIADAATNTRGATKDIGTALTRICLRHRAVEARIKTFSSAIMDCLVTPLQEKLEDWKKSVINLDKEHAKEYKRARAELKKRSTDTLRLQKKARSGKSRSGELQRRVENSLQEVTERRQLLEETEKRAVRAALVEERSRYCLLVAFLKPVVDEEVAMLSELSHLQEVVDQIQKHTADPYTLPPASEQVIADLKGCESSWTFQTPPSSPSSLGSRKSSMCSISSLNSSSSGSSKSHHSPNHHYWHRSLSQPLQKGILRLPSVSSQDSGFTSQDALFPRPPSVSAAKVSNASEPSSQSASGGSASMASNASNASSTPSTPFAGGAPPSALPIATSTWPNLQETLQFERAATAIMSDRPHTISSAYERGHQRPALSVYTFQAPDAGSHSQPASPVSSSAANVTAVTAAPENNNNIRAGAAAAAGAKPQPIYARPPIPQRCSSLERPSVPSKSPCKGKGTGTHPGGRPTATPKAPGDGKGVLKGPPHGPPHIHMGKDSPQPMYVNMHELASLAASKAQEMIFPPPPPEAVAPAAENHEKPEGAEKDGSTSESSLESSSGYGSQTIPVDEAAHNDDLPLSVYSLEAASKFCTLPRTCVPVSAGAPRRRPVSASGFPPGAARSALLRRGSAQGHKPPPPIRRTASISSAARHSTLGHQTAAGLQGLGLQAAGLQAANLQAAGLQGVCLQGPGPHVASPPAALASGGGSLENLPPPPAFLLEGAPNSSEGATEEERRAVSVAEAVRTLTELKHQPASPTALRRANRSQSADRRPLTAPGPLAPLGHLGLAHAEPSAGLIAALSAKLAPSLSPRNARRHSEDLPPPPGHGAGAGGGGGGGRLLQKGLAGPGQGFLHSLNTKLALQQQQLQMHGPQHKAARIRQLIASRTLPDPGLCHESLMDQIKRGTTLRRAGHVNDRSAPKIR